MDFGLQNIEDYTKDLHWMLQATAQLEKEFSQYKWEFVRPIQAETAFSDLEKQLFPKLRSQIALKGDSYCKQLLYRIDISESQVAKAMALEQDKDFTEILTKLIIRRCLQKVLIRNYYKSQEKDALGNCLEE